MRNINRLKYKLHFILIPIKFIYNMARPKEESLPNAEIVTIYIYALTSDVTKEARYE